MDEEFSRSFERFRTFLNTEPIAQLLGGNLTFLAGRDGAVDSAEPSAELGSRTVGRRVLVGGYPFLMRDRFDRRHWAAGMRITLAHEVQHDNSSDKLVLAGLRRKCGEYLRDAFGTPPEAGEAIGHRLLNFLEDARVNNIVCGRFPGYLSMMRFVNYAAAESIAPSDARDPAERGLRDMLRGVEQYALSCTGGENIAELCAYIDRAASAKTAGECADICFELFKAAGGRIAALCADMADLSSFAAELEREAEAYAFSDADRREQKGDGRDSGVRGKAKAGRDEKKGGEGDQEDAPGEKGEDGSPGSGDNSVRQGDESGSLTGEEAKPKATAGNNGREDRGESDSDGRSSNHGATGRGLGMNNSQSAAFELAGEEGPRTMAEVIGAGYSEKKSPALTQAEIDDMLRTASAGLDAAAKAVRESRVEPGGKTPLSGQNLSTLKKIYGGVTFRETFVQPENRSLPPEYLEQAKRLHQRLDRILREQRVRTANQRKGSLSQKALWKAEVNDPDIFQRKSPPTKYESAFYLLVDRSGSMGTGCGNGNSKLFTALLTAAVIEEALKGLAYTKVAAFDGGPENVEHVIIKDFSQKESGCRCFDALDQVFAGNGNKDGYSIRTAAMELEKRSEARRVLIVLSDGLPSAYYKESEAIADVRSAVQEARRRGIVVIPIMYGADDSPETFAAYASMYEKGIISTSPENILEEFEKLLMKLIR
jgi:hypothetical protein